MNSEISLQNERVHYHVDHLHEAILAAVVASVVQTLPAHSLQSVVSEGGLEIMQGVGRPIEQVLQASVTTSVEGSWVSAG